MIPQFGPVRTFLDTTTMTPDRAHDLLHRSGRGLGEYATAGSGGDRYYVEGFNGENVVRATGGPAMTLALWGLDCWEQAWSRNKK